MTSDPDKIFELNVKLNERLMKKFEKQKEEEGFSTLVVELFSDLKLQLSPRYLQDLKDIDEYMARFKIPLDVLAYCCALDEFLIKAPNKALFFYVWKHCEFYNLIKTKATTRAISIFYTLKRIQNELKPYYTKQ